MELNGLIGKDWNRVIRHRLFWIYLGFYGKGLGLVGNLNREDYGDGLRRDCVMDSR